MFEPPFNVMTLFQDTVLLFYTIWRNNITAYLIAFGLVSIDSSNLLKLKTPRHFLALKDFQWINIIV